MPVRGTLILSRRHSEVGWPVPFLAAFNFPSVATRYPFAAGWTVSEHPNYDPRVRLEPSMFRTAVKRSNHLATRPSEVLYQVEKSTLLFHGHTAVIMIQIFIRPLYHELPISPQQTLFILILSRKSWTCRGPFQNAHDAFPRSHSMPICTVLAVHQLCQQLSALFASTILDVPGTRGKATGRYHAPFSVSKQ